MHHVTVAKLQPVQEGPELAGGDPVLTPTNEVASLEYVRAKQVLRGFSEGPLSVPMAKA